MPLPFKTNPPHINTKSSALHRFKLLEKKFKTDPVYKTKYHDFMADIISKGEAVMAPTDSSNSWYIPHFGVFHPHKPDRIRVVFDCAAKVGGVSLNDHLLQGPDHMNDLQGILLRFRKSRIAFMGDIERMFHQFKVLPEHQEYLKFIWYDECGMPVAYKMTVPLFGARSSPACATYGLRFLADRFQSSFPSTASPSHHFIHRNFYVDDGLASVSSESEAVDLIKQTQSLCQSGQLRLHKIVSNSRSVMSHLPRSECSNTLATLDLSSDPLPQERSLGVLWDTEKDQFTFQHCSLNKPDTRRGVLSTVASVFDPLGLIAPFALQGRIILQETCRGNPDWDVPLINSLLTRWSAWKTDLTSVGQISIPRCLTPHDFNSVESAQLHTFADASTVGYGHCTYLRFVNSARKVHAALLSSKAKVAPMKQVTVPRLELQAAASAVRAVNKYVQELDIPNITTHFYSDSTVVLGYISNTSDRFHTYVAIRVDTIRHLSDPERWKHVPTSCNPADLSSRGASIEELMSSDWLTGPPFLWSEPLTLPPQPHVHISPDDVEVKQLSLSLASQAITFSLDHRMRKFSDWNRAVGAVATIRKRLSKTDHPVYRTLSKFF